MWGKVYFALEGMCPHSLTHWICIEKCANTHLNAVLLCIEMCVCTLLNMNPMGERVRVCALKGKKQPSYMWLM